jgi:hypothetical protein
MQAIPPMGCHPSRRTTLTVPLLIICAPFGVGIGWLIGRQLSKGLAVLASVAATIAWFYVAGTLVTHSLSNNCTNCHSSDWAFLIIAPITTLGFVVGLIPGIVMGRRGQSLKIAQEVVNTPGLNGGNYEPSDQMAPTMPSQIN